MHPPAGVTLTWFSPFTTATEPSGASQSAPPIAELCSSAYPSADAGQATISVLLPVAKIRSEGRFADAISYAPISTAPLTALAFPSRSDAPVIQDCTPPAPIHGEV